MLPSFLSFIFLFIVSISTVMGETLMRFYKHHIDNSGNIVDENGQVKIFHGVNFVAKQPPWYHEPLLDPSYAQDLRGWGLNVVRLGTMWSGLEPREGYYDMEYVEKLKQIITNFKDNGIYVILDMHQDVASQQFETYDGFPAWLVEKLRTGAERQFPWPLAGIENWFCGYVTYEACHVFQGFYDNKYEAVDRLARVWAVIAQELGQFPNILGYNILNEPWAGNIYKDGSLILPAEVGRKNLAPMYEKIHAAIREVDRDTLLFWEPATWSHWGFNSNIEYINKLVIGYFRRNSALTWISGISNACGALKLNIDDEGDLEFCQSLKNYHRNNRTSSNQILPEADLADCFVQQDQTLDEIGDAAFGTGMSNVPGGEDFRNRSIMSWHYYFPLFLYGMEDYVWWQKDLAHRVFGPSVFGGSNKEIKKLGGGQFLTEFGICVPDASKPEHWGTQECEWIMERADQHSLSWCYWDTSNLGVLWRPDGSTIDSASKILSRPYPIAVSGTELKYSFDIKSKIFKLEFKSKTDIKELSLIYLPPFIYEKGNLQFKHSEDLSVQVSKDNENILEIHAKKEANTTKSWVVVGISGDIPSLRTLSLFETFLSFIPFLNR